MAPTPTKCPLPEDPRQRMLKVDGPLLIQLLEDQGFEVHTRGDRIDAYHGRGRREFVCGFTWYKGTPNEPGRWTFDLTLGDAHSWQDVKTLLRELKRVHTQRKNSRTAWLAFLESKSDKRWSNYLSHIALMFLIRTPQDPNGQ